MTQHVLKVNNTNVFDNISNIVIAELTIKNNENTH